MNKRQRKKRLATIRERVYFINKNIGFRNARAVGKTTFYKYIYKMCYSKRYKQFNEFKKTYKKMLEEAKLIKGIDYNFSKLIAAQEKVTKIISHKTAQQMMRIN